MNMNLNPNGKFITLISVAFLACLLLCGSAYIAHPVESKLSGKLIYSDKSMVADAVVSILNSDDKSLVTSGLTEADGTFKFAEIEAGSYYISIQLSDMSHKTFGPINITEDQKHLVIKTLVMPAPAAAQKVVIKAANVANASLSI